MNEILEEIETASTRVLIENLSVIYGKNKAVDNLTLDINQKELFVLLGPSGCGKTTTLSAIGGLIKPTSGTIWLGKKLVTDIEGNIFIRPQDRDLAMVFQDYAIYPHMTVYQNIAFPLETRGMPRIQIESKVKKTAETLEIDHLLGRKPKQLSGGQRQRVALGRAIVREPRAFLMDEPLSNLDAKLRVYARAELKKLHERIGATIIYVTHDQIEAMSIGDRIAILNLGRLEQIGTPDDVYNRPVNKFVAGFIGDPPINFLEGKILEGTNSLLLDLGPFFGQIKLNDEKLINKISKEKDVILGIRPEHIEISSYETANSIKAEINVIEPAGREFVLHLLVGTTILVAVINASANKDLKQSDHVWIEIKYEQVHIFDKETELNLKL